MAGRQVGRRAGIEVKLAVDQNIQFSDLFSQGTAIGTQCKSIF